MWTIPVFQHKTAQQPALVVLDEEDYERMRLYYSNLRQTLEADRDPGTSNFFRSYTSARCSNVSKELTKFSEDNGYANYTSTHARKAAETGMQGSMNKEQQQLVCDYLNHGDATAKKYYRHDSYHDAIMAQKLINKLSPQIVVQDNVEEQRCVSPTSVQSSVGSSDEEFITQCYNEFPLSADASIPKAKEIRKAVDGIPGDLIKTFLTRYRRHREMLQIDDWAKTNSRIYKNGLPDGHK